VFEDRFSFTGLSEKLLHIQDDSNLDEVIEALFKEILTLVKSTEALKDHVLFFRSYITITS